MGSSKQVRFSELLTLHVSNTIKKQFLHEALTPDSLRGMRDLIRKTVGDVFRRSTHQLTEESINWISNQFFKSIRLNGDQTVSNMVVINEYKLADLPYHDIQLMRNLFNETQMSPELEEEYRRRSTS